MRRKKPDFQFSPRQRSRKKALHGAVTAAFLSPAGNPQHRPRRPVIVKMAWAIIANCRKVTAETNGEQQVKSVNISIEMKGGF